MEGVSQVGDQVCVPGDIHDFIYVCWVQAGIGQVWACLSTETCISCHILYPCLGWAEASASGPGA